MQSLPTGTIQAVHVKRLNFEYFMKSVELALLEKLNQLEQFNGPNCIAGIIVYSVVGVEIEVIQGNSTQAKPN